MGLSLEGIQQKFHSSFEVTKAFSKKVHDFLPDTSHLARPDTYSQILPSSSNILYSIPGVIGSSFKLVKGISLKQKETIVDSSCKLTSYSISLIDGISNCLFYASLFVKFFENQTLSPIVHLSTLVQALKITVISGTILCVLEGIVEGNSLRRVLFSTSKKNFGLNLLPKDLSTSEKMRTIKTRLEKNQNSVSKYLTQEEKILYAKLLSSFDINTQNPDDLVASYLFFQLAFFKNKYLTIPQENTEPSEQTNNNPHRIKALQANIIHLTNRIGVLARQFLLLDQGNSPQNQLDPILLDLQDMNPTIRTRGITEAKEFIHLIHVQRVKKSLLHILGLVNTLLSIGGFITLCTTAPWGVPVAIIATGYLVWFLRYGLATGWLTTKSYWSFSFVNTLPFEIRYGALVIRNIFQKLYPVFVGS